MIEIMRAMVDLLARVVPALFRARRDTRLREVGAELFLLYVRLNEALVCADRIVDQLTACVSGRSPARAAPATLRYELAKQHVTMQRISGLLESQRIQLILLDAGVYHQLVPLVSAKVSSLQTLIATLRAGHLPIDVADHDLRTLASGEGWEDGLPPPAHERILSRIRADALPGDRWDPDTVIRVAAYLRHRDPKGQLDRIRDAVEQLRAALVAHFSVEDMLLAVGDHRFDSSN